MRHGKSIPSSDGLDDFERPLKRRGQRDALKVGTSLAQSGRASSLLLTSPATRALQTAERVASSAGVSQPPVPCDSLYPGDQEAVVTSLRGVGDGHTRVMVVGHNPCLENLVEELTGRAETLTTASVAVVDLDIDCWADLGRGEGGALVEVLRPREHSGASAGAWRRGGDTPACPG
jgi:phosphohistidine phosphatase